MADDKGATDGRSGTRDTDQSTRRKQDPHGTAPASKAAEDEPKGRPTSDRHDMETTVAKQTPRP